MLNLKNRKNSHRYLEIFIFTSVATIVLTRTFLFLAGYPKLSPGGLHIAHVLWGGLFMLVAILLEILFADRRLLLPKIISGGIGFGLFIDELGKFVTADNNYFFRPTFSIVYIIFVIIIFIAEVVNREEDFVFEEVAMLFSKQMISKLHTKFIKWSIICLGLWEVLKSFLTTLLLAQEFFTDHMLEFGEVVLASTSLTMSLVVGIMIFYSWRWKKPKIQRAAWLNLMTNQILIFSINNLLGLIFLITGLLLYGLSEIYAQGSKMSK